MVRFLAIAVLAAVSVFACTSTRYRSVGTSGHPETGTYYIYTPDNRILQKSVWRQGKLVSAWEYTRKGEDLSLEQLLAVHRGERDWPPTRWVQRVINGNGDIVTWDEQGREIGFERYLHGEFVWGAH